MSRLFRRAAPADARDETGTITPTRNDGGNAINGMLDTPPQNPYLTTPAPPTANHGDGSIVPDAHRSRYAQASTLVQPDPQETSRTSMRPLGVAGDDAEPFEEHSLMNSMLHAEDMEQLVGLREISSLATWTLSSAKPGCGLAQLRNPSPAQFWQSDGPQPHSLNLHFFKLVSIVKVRVYLDFKLDESYTPTKMKFSAGMSEGGLIEFATWEAEDITDPETGDITSSVEKVRGWIDISLKGVGGHEPSYYAARDARQARRYERKYGTDGCVDEMDTDSEDEHDLVGGDVLRCMILQVKISENHQNGKDTHVRGFQVFAKDENAGKEARRVIKRGRKSGRTGNSDGEPMVSLRPAEWMMEPDIR